MPNLVGIGLSQVPTNSMLGGLAYQNPEHASIKDLDLKNLSQINSEIADTAVDVFIYDTSKDSDGGAWRKRTQNTSWYNETLGTATRGTRKEFPAVAVIVAELAQLTIYDGDNPDLSMWMVFNFLDGENHFNGYDDDRYLSSVAALNGTIVTGIGHVNGYLNEIGFIEDAGYSRTPGYYQKLHANISQRDQTGFSKTLINTSDGIVNRNVNDVAMTVLPNAPIDSATGLPVPTIAVGTEGGVSVIKDDGTVVDLTGSDTYVECNNVFFSDYGKLLYDNEDTQVVYEVSIPSSDTNYGAYNSTSNGRVVYPVGAHLGFSSGEIRLLGSNIANGGRLITKGAFAVDENGASETINGLTLFDREETKPAFNSLFAYVASDYNTGWMHGDIKGAFLSDTDATNVTGSNLIDNGDFSSALDTNVWINYNSTSNVATYSIVSGELKVIENNTNDYGIVSQHLTGLTVGKQYGISVDSRATTATARWFVGNSQGSAGIVSVQDTTSSTFVRKSAVWTAVSTDAYVNLAAVGAAGATAYFDNITVKEVEPDRSVNNNGLQVFGTITKSAVATGAELVGYSGFSASNYLKQSYNSDFNFGTGSFSIMAWFKLPTSGSGVLLYRGTSDGDETFRIYMDKSNYGIYFDYGGGTSYSKLSNSNDINAIWNEQWNQFVCHAKASGEVKIYVNGVSKDITVVGAPPSTFSSTATNVLNIGTSYSGSAPFPGSVALLRVSASVPSAEQIKKIYEDEKILFQENAKATLYGSSDAVTALAFDDIPNLLHVGTSAGRSEFQGLRRINNTTTAVTTAISASNGLVAEQ